jgi:hypothetical protein
MRRHYEGLVVKTPNGAFQIDPRPWNDDAA